MIHTFNYESYFRKYDSRFRKDTLLTKFTNQNLFKKIKIITKENFAQLKLVLGEYQKLLEEPKTVREEVEKKFGDKRNPQRVCLDYQIRLVENQPNHWAIRLQEAFNVKLYCEILSKHYGF